MEYSGTQAAHERYDTIPDPTGTGTTASNTIVEIDVHVDGSTLPGPTNEEYTLEPAHLATIADQLSVLGADDASARVEIERRHMASNEQHILRFTARELTEIMVPLAIARTGTRYKGNQRASAHIETFARVLDASHDAPLVDDYTEVEYGEMVPSSGAYIDPLQVCLGNQDCWFTDGSGNRISADEFDPSDLAQ